jgi:diguanylate cyclase (GGDEF)-like protein
MGITCDRLEKLTECFADIKMLNESNGLCSRLEFLKILETEIQRSQSYRTNLSLCFVKLNLEEAGAGFGKSTENRILRSLGEIISEEIRNWDTLHQYDQQTYALLMPQTTFDEAQHFCNRLKSISDKNFSESADLRVKLAFGLAELAHGKDETGPDLLAKVTAVLQNAG